nr:FkbM family methyltransferase [uncultured Roseococcus sp.]
MPRTTMEIWRPNALRRFLSGLAYPLVWALNRPGAAPLNRGLYDLALRLNGMAINYPGRHHLGRAEERLLEALAPELAGQVVLDVGANAGHYARCVRHFAPAARIWAFEPHPVTYRALEESARPLGIETQQLALGDRAGEMQLHDFADGDGSTQASLSAESVGLYSGRVVTHDVEVSTVDEWLAAQGLEEIALLKIDTEGYDLNVLKGASRALQERRIHRIQFEFIPANIGTRVAMRDFYEVLQGYRISRLCLNGGLMPLGAYDVKRCEIYVTQILVAERE